MEFIPCRCLFRAKKVAASAVTLAAIWRSGRDSNPRAVARKLISSQPRYDHFDTAAYKDQPVKSDYTIE